MSPEPYVRGQLFVLAALFVAMTVLNARFETLGLTLATYAGAVALRRKYRRDLRLTPSCLPCHRERLDLIITGDLRTAIVLGLAVSISAIAYDAGPLVDVGTARSVAVALAAVTMTFYLSSLVDWYITLPRISGQLGARPCRSATEQPGVFPRTWRETTRWWYIHRIVAALALRFGLGYAITLAVSGLVSLDLEKRVLAAAALGAFASYGPLKLFSAVRETVREGGQPRLFVGQTVQRYRPERKVRWQLRLGKISFLTLHRDEPLAAETFAREYVYDVAVEGVQLVPVASRESPVQPEEVVRFERDPNRIPVKDVDLTHPAAAFTGCDQRCSGINWYCIENPQCFEPK